MASISNVQLKTFKQFNANNLWVVEVNYDANFAPQELQAKYTFREGFVVWEDDSSYDDELTGLAGTKDFVPANTKEPRTMKYTLDGSVLDTELGGEEIYVVVHLRNKTLNVAMPTQSSPTQNISP